MSQLCEAKPEDSKEGDVKLFNKIVEHVFVTQDIKMQFEPLELGSL